MIDNSVFEKFKTTPEDRLKVITRMAWVLHDAAVKGYQQTDNPCQRVICAASLMTACTLLTGLTKNMTEELLVQNNLAKAQGVINLSHDIVEKMLNEAIEDAGN